MKNICLTMMLLFMSTVAFASERETSPLSTISRLVSYSKFGNGDIYVRLAKPATQCAGYYVSLNSTGFKATLSMLIAAYQAKTNIRITGYINNKWSGSSNYVCEIYAVTYG